MKTISIIIPCFNEEESLAKLFDALQVLEQILMEKYLVDFIFVDDGSKDKTLAILEEKKFLLKKVKILKHETNKNLGTALQTAINSLETRDFVGFLDSDCTYEPNLIEEMLKKSEEGFDIVTVSPYHPLGKVEGVPEWRLVLSKGISLIYQIILGKKMYTFTAMVRIYKGSKLKAVVGTRPDFAFVAEMMINAIKEKYTIYELPAVLKQREFGVSKMRLLNTIKAHLELVLRILLGWKKLK